MYLPMWPQIVHLTPCTWQCPHTSQIGSRSRLMAFIRDHATNRARMTCAPFARDLPSTWQSCTVAAPPPSRPGPRPRSSRVHGAARARRPRARQEPAARHERARLALSVR